MAYLSINALLLVLKYSYILPTYISLSGKHRLLTVASEATSY